MDFPRSKAYRCLRPLRATATIRLREHGRLVKCYLKSLIFSNEILSERNNVLYLVNSYKHFDCFHLKNVFGDLFYFVVKYIYKKSSIDRIIIYQKTSIIDLDKF